MPDVQPPVIVLPGITASHLRDEYPMDPEGVWGLLSKAWDRIHLHPDDTRYELRQPSRVMSDKVFGIPYKHFVEDLRHDLSPAEDRPTPVYPFHYDWRQPLDRLEEELDAFVEEVVERTALLRHYHAAGYDAETGSVDLVGHSMGGLLIAGYVERSEGRRVRKAATLGTPFKGSFEAVLKMITGLSTLGDASSREREVARLTPALYHLLPRYRDAVTADGDLGKDLFRAATWQRSVVETIAEQIRLRGLDGVGKSREECVPAAKTLFQRLLQEASDHRVRIGGLALGNAGMSRDDWMAIVGLGEETRVHLHIHEGDDGEPWFNLSSTDRKDGYPDGATDENGFRVARPMDTGDGTVPYEGAQPTFLGAEQLVCVTDDDFGYWELRDRFLEGGLGGKSVGLHGMLPAMNVVEKLVVCHLKGEAGAKGSSHPGVWGRRAPGVEAGAWNPPLAGLRERS